MNRNKTLPLLIAVVGSLLLLAVLFLPFASATKENKEVLLVYADEMYASEIDMTNKDAVNISLLEFGRIYIAAAREGLYKDIAIICLVIIAVFALFAVLTVLFCSLRKPIASIIFDILSFAAFKLLMFDFKDRGVIVNNNYDFGFAEIICYLGTVIVIVGAILLIIEKVKAKKSAKTSVSEQEKTVL